MKSSVSGETVVIFKDLIQTRILKIGDERLTSQKGRRDIEKAHREEWLKFKIQDAETFRQRFWLVKQQHANNNARQNYFIPPPVPCKMRHQSTVTSDNLSPDVTPDEQPPVTNSHFTHSAIHQATCLTVSWLNWYHSSGTEKCPWTVNGRQVARTLFRNRFDRRQLAE